MAFDTAIHRIENLATAYWMHATTKTDYLNHGPNWDADYWDRVTRHEALNGFSWKPEWGQKVSRGLIRDQWRAATTPVDALNAFFLTMAWGFGSNFRGRWKTIAMFDSMQNENFGTYLLKVRDDAQGSPSEVFSSLLQRGITQLGPVYASKLLYAVSSDSNCSPVMDIWIEKWGKGFNLDFAVRSSWKPAKNVEALERFTEFCNSAAEALFMVTAAEALAQNANAGFVEYLIFWDAKYRGSRWKKSKDFPNWVQDVSLR